MDYSILLHTLGHMGRCDPPYHWTNASEYIRANSVNRLCYAMTHQWAWSVDDDCPQRQADDGLCVYIQWGDL